MPYIMPNEFEMDMARRLNKQPSVIKYDGINLPKPDYKAKYLELLKRISKLQDEHITLLHENIKLLVDSQLKDKD